jgi:hypothetical protein
VQASQASKLRVVTNVSKMRAAAKYKKMCASRSGRGVWERIGADAKEAIINEICDHAERSQIRTWRRVEQRYVAAWVIAGAAGLLIPYGDGLAVVAGFWAVAHGWRIKCPAFRYDHVLAHVGTHHSTREEMKKRYREAGPQMQNPQVVSIVRDMWHHDALAAVSARTMLETDAREWGAAEFVERRCGAGSFDMFLILARQELNAERTIDELCGVLERVGKAGRSGGARA